jgi:hypothetical protein
MWKDKQCVPVVHMVSVAVQLPEYDGYRQTSVIKTLLKSKRIPFIFNDESTGSCICLRLDLYLSHVLLLCLSVTFILVPLPLPQTAPTHVLT